MAFVNWADIWADIWGDVWATEDVASVRRGGKYVRVVERREEIPEVPREPLDLRKYDLSTGKEIPAPVVAPPGQPEPPVTPPLADSVGNVVAFTPKAKPVEIDPYTPPDPAIAQADTNTRLILLLAA